MKISLVKKYDIKDFSEVKTIIEWQIYRDSRAGIIKIDQLAFVQDLVIKKRLTKYNANVILITAGSFIDMSDLEDYKEVDLQTYQCLIEKLMNLTYDTRPDIIFAVGQLSRYNANPKKFIFKSQK